MAEKKQKQSGKISTYFRDLKAEFKRISWPTFKQVRNNTGVVIAFIVILGLFIALIDFGFTALYNVILK